MNFPFQESHKSGKRIRTFSSETHPEELVWHRDDEDRLVRILESDGWYFQRDGELPQKLNVGDELLIKKHEWHRVIMKKQSKLVVEIESSP